MIDHTLLESRRSSQLVVVATLVALPLRVWPLGRLGLNQFDEGIYAMAAGWAVEPTGLEALSPGLIAYSPPGYPILVGLSSWLIGLGDQTGLLVSAVLGSLTVPVVAWVGHLVSGPRTAAIAAWCACLSGPHIAFSRMGLTDASFLFVWSIGMVAGIKFLSRPGFRSSLILGLCVGLNQEFKYNGWLLGAWLIASAALEAIRPVDKRFRRHWVRLGAWGGLAIVVSCLVVLPWFLFVENHGGYSALLAHQRSYLSSASAWWPHLRNQVDQAVALSGPSWLGLVNSILIGSVVVMLPTDGTIRVRGLQGLVLACLIWPLLASPLCVGILAIAAHLASTRPGERLVAISWLGFLGLTPFYHPYARLWLPLEMLHWVLLGGFASQVFVLLGAMRPSGPETRRFSPTLIVLVIFAGGFWIAGPGFPFATPGPLNHPDLFEPSDSLRLAAGEVVQQLPPKDVVLRTLMRPSMSYYLSSRIMIRPQSDLSQLDRSALSGDWALIDSTVVSNSGAGFDRARLGSTLSRWDVIAEIPARNSLPTALDLDPGFRGREGDQSWANFWVLRRQPLDVAP